MTPTIPHPDAACEPDWRPRVVGDLIVEHHDGHAILLHPTLPRWAVTNASGLESLAQFDGAHSLGETAAAIAAEFDLADAAQPLTDLTTFAHSLAEAGLLEDRPLPRRRPGDHRTLAPDFVLFITEECNLRCKHCGYVEGKMPKSTLTADECRALIDQHLAMHPGATVSITGGEPLLHPDTLDILEYACARTPYVNINTNGLLFTDAIAERLARSGAWIQISLDGAVRETHEFIRGKGSFDKAWEAIEWLCRLGAAGRTLVATTLTRCVLTDVQRLVERVDALGLFELRLLTLNKMKAAITNWDRITPDPEEMRRVYRWLLIELPRLERQGATNIAASFPGFVPDPDPDGEAWCPLGETMIVDSQGALFNCPSFRGAEWEVGSVRDGSLSDLVAGDRNQAMRRKMLDRRYAVEECRTCAWRNFCQGSCAAFTALRTGDFYLNDEFCEFRRELYREHVVRTALLGPVRPGVLGPKC